MRSYLDRFRAAPPATQLTALAAAVVTVAILIGLLWFFALRANYAPLFSNMRAADAATIVAELDRQKIPYRLSEGGTTILVPEDKADATRLAVMGEDLPLKGTVGFELFNKSEMGLTDFAQKINYQRALQGELARTIMALEGVDAARVHLSLGEDRLFREDRVAPKASVTVRMRPGAKLSDNATLGIQRLIAAAVPKLDLADVVVLDDHGQIISAASAGATAEADRSPLAEERRAIAGYYEAQLRAAFDQHYPGKEIDVSVGLGLVEASGGENAPLPSWNPAARTFPIHIVIDPSRTLDESERQALRDLAARAVGFDAALGDDIIFGHVAPAWEAPLQPNPAPRSYAPSSTAAPDMSVEPAPANLGLVEVAGIAVIILAGIMFGWRLIRRRAEPTPRAKLFADQLRAALAEEDGHARNA